MPGETQSRRMVAFSVSFYIVTAIVMVLVNKWVLDVTILPLTFLWWQLIIAVVLLHVSSFLNIVKLPNMTKDTSKRLMPLICINVLGLTLNTLCLKYVDASFYQVARALVLPFTITLTYLLLHKPSSKGILFSASIVFMGFLWGISGENLESIYSASAIGIFFGIFSSCTTALHAIVIKKSLDVVSGSTMDLVYYNNVLSSLLLLPIILLSGEVGMIWSPPDGATGSAFNHTFWVGAVLTGFFGFLINIAGTLQIAVTSPVTHMISSAVRGVLQTFLAVWIFGDVLTTGRVGGIVLILVGSTLYAWVREVEARKQRKMASSDAGKGPQQEEVPMQRKGDYVAVPVEDKQ